MVSFDLDNPWIFISLSVVVWVAIRAVIEMTLLDGEVVTALGPAVVSGPCFGFVAFYIRQQGWV
jgi:hypothetical protein